MKKNIIFSSITIIIGALITVGPFFLFKACPTGCCSAYPECLFMNHAQLGMGMIIAALGVFLFVYTDPKTQLGMTIGIFLAGVMSLLISHVIIGGCTIKTMECRLVTIPVLTVLGIFIVVWSGIKILSLRKEIKNIRE